LQPQGDEILKPKIGLVQLPRCPWPERYGDVENIVEVPQDDQNIYPKESKRRAGVVTGFCGKIAVDQVWKELYRHGC
jgi:hypothetical protein